MPLSLYFDIENYSDRPVDYQVEYLSPRGFQPVRITDQTGGFCGSGTILFMVPQDAVQKNLYGYEGYFLRFVNYNRENPEYVLPQVKGILSQYGPGGQCQYSDRRIFIWMIWIMPFRSSCPSRTF